MFLIDLFSRLANLHGNNLKKNIGIIYCPPIIQYPNMCAVWFQGYWPPTTWVPCVELCRRLPLRIMVKIPGTQTGSMQRRQTENGISWLLMTQRPSTRKLFQVCHIKLCTRSEWNHNHLAGLIIVYTGILPVCQDEQGLAAVLSHGVCFTSNMPDTPDIIHRNRPCWYVSNLVVSQTLTYRHPSCQACG